MSHAVADFQLLIDFFAASSVSLVLPCFPVYRNVAKMEDAKVKIDDGKEESLVPDTMYQ